MLVGAVVEGARDPHAGRHRRLGLDREVGEHIAHGGLVGQRGPEGVTMAAVPHRLGNQAAHHPRDAVHRVDPRPDDLLDHERGAAALLAEDPRG